MVDRKWENRKRKRGEKEENKRSRTRRWMCARATTRCTAPKASPRCSRRFRSLSRTFSDSFFLALVRTRARAHTTHIHKHAHTCTQQHWGAASSHPLVQSLYMLGFCSGIRFTCTNPLSFVALSHLPSIFLPPSLPPSVSPSLTRVSHECCMNVYV